MSGRAGPKRLLDMHPLSRIVRDASLAVLSLARGSEDHDIVADLHTQMVQDLAGAFGLDLPPEWSCGFAALCFRAVAPALDGDGHGPDDLDGAALGLLTEALGWSVVGVLSAEAAAEHKRLAVRAAA